MMGIMETGEGGFSGDRLVELINYCVAGDGTRERESWDSASSRADLGHYPSPLQISHAV